MKRATARASAKSKGKKAGGGKAPARSRLWNPDHPAVSIRRQPGQQLDAVLRHESYPYTEDWTEADGMAGLFAIAGRYLKCANRHLGLPLDWLEDLVRPGTGKRIQLRWLVAQDDPRSSCWVQRYAGLKKRSPPKAHQLLDRSAVLLAGLCVPDSRKTAKDGLFRLYGGQGLHVIAHVGTMTNGVAPVRIIGARTRLPTLPSAPRVVPLISLLEKEPIDVLVESLREKLSAKFGLAEDHVVVSQGFLLQPDADRGRAAMIVLSKTAPTEKGIKKGERESFALAARMKIDRRSGLVLEPLHKRPLVTGVQAKAMVYDQDPMSKNGAQSFTQFRPRQPSGVLNTERVRQEFGDLPAGVGAGTVQLVDPDPNGDPDFRVTNSMLVDLAPAAGSPKEVPATSTADVRTNEFAAVNAFHHTAGLFERMRQYGLPPTEYFRRVARPIDVNYRSGIRPGAGDGRTVNAQVRWTQRPGSETTGTIELCLALGDLQSAVGRLPTDLASAVERSPLGVAADSRWCWHEYCHVLIAAATGELEFGFAHSAGDALAAILKDPDSKLVCDENGAVANDGGWRGVTYPWVQIPRRHDRDVQRGWGWCGPLNQRERYFTVPGVLDKRGYWTEQILSTTLFRLYRAIGGDCELSDNGKQVPAKKERGDAANYTAYLIMRAIQMLGDGEVTPSTSPECFVQAMIEADAGTAGAPGIGGYSGGSVRKVVQWTFERQGLYAVPLPGSRVAGPDELAKVDLHIEDRRLKPVGPYSPVDLLGTAWHAHLQSIVVKHSPVADVANKIFVNVENRGQLKATNVTVEVWVAPVNGGAIPPYPDNAWYSLGTFTHDVKRATGQNPGSKRFGPFRWTPLAPQQDYAILVSASCEADRSNIDPAAGLPCASVPGPVRTLVACDNNLGLTLVKTS